MHESCISQFPQFLSELRDNKVIDDEILGGLLQEYG